MSEFIKPKAIESVTKEQLKALSRSMSPMARMIGGLNDADSSKGRGVLDGNDRCLWTHDKRRITIHASPEALIVSTSKDQDPHCPQ